MSLQDDLRNAIQSAKTHEAICQSLIAENNKYRHTLQYIAADCETQGHPEYIGMNRLASYAKETLSGSDWLDEFEAIETAIMDERKACYNVAQSALCHGGLDMTTVNYITGNIKARGLDI